MVTRPAIIVLGPGGLPVAERIAVCTGGEIHGLSKRMESVKVAMPKTGAMVDPIKHPNFAAALTAWKRAREKRAG